MVLSIMDAPSQKAPMGFNVEELMDEKWKAEKRIAPEHNEEVDLYQSAVLCNRTLPFISWHIIGILGASLILFFTL